MFLLYKLKMLVICWSYHSQILYFVTAPIYYIWHSCQMSVLIVQFQFVKCANTVSTPDTTGATQHDNLLVLNGFVASHRAAFSVEIFLNDNGF